jgi:hypothetical protein
LLNVAQQHEKLRPLVTDFERLVLKDVAPPGLDISRALEICTLLFGAMFRPEIRVQADYTAATVSERKACRSIKSSAARKRLKIMEELKCNEKIV